MQTFLQKGIFGTMMLCSLLACESQVEVTKPAEEEQPIEDLGVSAAAAQLKNYSVTPPLLLKKPGFESVELFGLISSDDELNMSPSFRFGGSADGAALMKTQTGYSLIVNHEDNFAVSRVSLNGSFRPKKGEYILNSDGGQWRLCSGTLATPAEHGFGPVFLTCGESGEESRTHALDPLASPEDASVSREIPGLGRWSAENAVPLPKQAYPGKTVIIVGDDDSGVNGGQVAMYVSEKIGDLSNGKLYVLRRTDLNTTERAISLNQPVAVEFVEIENHKTLTGSQINALSSQLYTVAFGRVEDIDYRKNGTGREVYFNVTGQDNKGTNADYSRTKYGRVYKLVLDEANPLSGTLEVVLDGDERDSKAGMFQNPDNILVTDNYAYIQEDPNGGYLDQTHDAYIYQYNLATGELKVVFELDHRRNAPDALKYNVGSSSSYPMPVPNRSGYGSWEYGAFLDISEIVNIPNTFLLCIQPHTWRSNLYKGVDGGSLRPNEDQGSQVVIVRGLPK